jgi:hypothetical protein
MNKPVLELIIILGLPIVFFLIGKSFVEKFSNQKHIQEVLGNKHLKPLYVRSGGYNTDEVKLYWKALYPSAIEDEKRFLYLDLLFPLFYGSPLITSILFAWIRLNRPLSLIWFILPVIITMLSDWNENFIQLQQIKRFHSLEELENLEIEWIWVASTATRFKLYFFVISYLLLIGMDISIAYNSFFS